MRFGQKQLAAIAAYLSAVSEVSGIQFTSRFGVWDYALTAPLRVFRPNAYHPVCRIDVPGFDAAQFFSPKRTIIGHSQHHTVAQRSLSSSLQDGLPLFISRNPRQFSITW